VLTRSLLHILNIMAGYVDVPMEDIRDGRATPGVGSSGEAGRGVTKPKIRSSPDKPVDAFTSVQYQGQWFWVDNRDLATKRSFSFMMLIFTLADSSDRENLPLLTIPAQ